MGYRKAQYLLCAVFLGTNAPTATMRWFRAIRLVFAGAGSKCIAIYSAFLYLLVISWQFLFFQTAILFFKTGNIFLPRR
jgi:hypothetical protein